MLFREPEKQIAERKVREGEGGGGGGGGGGTDTSSTLGIILGSSLTLISILLVLLITGLCRYMTRYRGHQGTVKLLLLLFL